MIVPDDALLHDVLQPSGSYSFDLSPWAFGSDSYSSDSLNLILPMLTL